MNKLELEDLVVRYGSGEHLLTAVNHVDMAVPLGGTLGLVGESGCGKSTIAKAIAGLVPIAGGRLLVNGEDCSSQRARDSKAYRRRVQMVFQDPYSSLNPRMIIGEVIGEALSRRKDRPTGAAREAEARRLLDLVGLRADALDRHPHQFSGGQRQRIAIARALAVGPELIVLDEVTSALDVSVQATILTLLKELQRELGLSYLFISHDLSVVRFMSDQVAVMYLGQVVEHAATDEIFDAARHPYTRALISSVPQLGAERRKAPLSGDVPNPRNPPIGCRFHTRCPIGPLFDKTRTICIEQDPQTIAHEQEHHAACHFAASRAALPAIPDSAAQLKGA